MAQVDKLECQYSYEDGDDMVFLNMESFEEVYLLWLYLPWLYLLWLYLLWLYLPWLYLLWLYLLWLYLLWLYLPLSGLLTP